MNILFIGNSYTYYNDMPKMLESLARAAGFYAEVASVTKGGYTLARLASDDNENGRRVTAALSGDMKYDRVILQEQSVLSAAEPERFAEGLRAITEKLKEYQPQAVPVLYETWGAKRETTRSPNTGGRLRRCTRSFIPHMMRRERRSAVRCRTSDVRFSMYTKMPRGSSSITPT